MYIFLILALLIFGGIYWLIRKKLNIVEGGILYAHVNKIHKWVELILIAAWIVSSFVIVLWNPAVFKLHFIFIWLTVLFVFRAFMEYKFDKSSKRYILTILGAIFSLIVFLGIEFVFRNPVPVRLEADQVEEITIKHFSESANSYPITLTEKELIEPILSAISDGQYQNQIGTYSIIPRLEMIIKQKSGRETVIKEIVTVPYPGERDVIFMVHTERILFPKDMILHSQELKHVFARYCQ